LIKNLSRLRYFFVSIYAQKLYVLDSMKLLLADQYFLKKLNSKFENSLNFLYQKHSQKI